MKKYLLIFTLIIISIFIFTACGGENANPVPTPPGPPVETADPDLSGDDPGSDTLSPENPSIDDKPQLPDAFFFKAGDFVIDMNQNITYVIDNIGEPLGVFEAPSCAFDGIDRIFNYRNFGVQIYTYPAGDEDFIHAIGFIDDSVRTAEGGIRLGAGLQSVIDAYGENYEEDTGMYKFTRGRTSLEFLIDDDMVIGITYGYKVEQ